MWQIKIVVPGIIFLLFLVEIWRRKKKASRHVRVMPVPSNEENIRKTDNKKKKRYICIQVSRNDKRQINIRCMDLERNGIGELLAVYHKEGRENGEYQSSNTLHLEKIFVKKRYRRKGIGRTMFRYLINEMKKIEDEEGMEFRYIYGEVGEEGGDNPRISLPFYQKMAGMDYGEHATLSYRHTKKKVSEEYDGFTYYINRI